jgi:hypothetical protein
MARITHHPSAARRLPALGALLGAATLLAGLPAAQAASCRPPAPGSLQLADPAAATAGSPAAALCGSDADEGLTARVATERTPDGDLARDVAAAGSAGPDAAGAGDLYGKRGSSMPATADPAGLTAIGARSFATAEHHGSGHGNDDGDDHRASPAPLPASLWLLVSVLGGLLAVGRRHAPARMIRAAAAQATMR